MRKNERGLKMRGFTLLEAVLALGVIGAILGGVLAAAGHLREESRVSATVQQVMQVVQNIRDHHAGAVGLSGACGARPSNDVTTDLDDKDLFPANMRRQDGASYDINAAYGTASGPSDSGTFVVLGDDTNCAGTAATRFWVVLTNLSPTGCLKILTALPYKDQALGIETVCAAGEDGDFPCYEGTATYEYSVVCEDNFCETEKSGTKTPITPTQAAIMCASDTTSEVAWKFKLRN